MSIELLPADTVYEKEWHVESNYCNCHPETCCCDPWVVIQPDGEEYCTFFHKDIAQEICDLRNGNE